MQRQQDGAKEKYFFGHPVTVQVKKKDCNHLTYAPILSPLLHPLHQHHGHHLNSQKTPSVRVSSSSARDQQGVRVESRSSTLGRQTHRSAKQSKPSKRARDKKKTSKRARLKSNDKSSFFRAHQSTGNIYRAVGRESKDPGKPYRSS